MTMFGFRMQAFRDRLAETGIDLALVTDDRWSLPLRDPHVPI
jgi:hypothetical protein